MIVEVYFLIGSSLYPARTVCDNPDCEADDPVGPSCSSCGRSSKVLPETSYIDFEFHLIPRGDEDRMMIARASVLGEGLAEGPGEDLFDKLRTLLDREVSDYFGQDSKLEFKGAEIDYGISGEHLKVVRNACGTASSRRTVIGALMAKASEKLVGSAGGEGGV